MAIRHLKQIGKVKKFEKWVPHKLTEKRIVLKCHLHLSQRIRNSFFIGCDVPWKVDCIARSSVTNLVVSLRNSKVLPQTELQIMSTATMWWCGGLTDKGPSESCTWTSISLPLVLFGEVVEFSGVQPCWRKSLMWEGLEVYSLAPLPVRSVSCVWREWSLPPCPCCDCHAFPALMDSSPSETVNQNKCFCV